VFYLHTKSRTCAKVRDFFYSRTLKIFARDNTADTNPFS
jgi:hypothetical protein